MLEQFGLHVRGQAEAALVGDSLCILVDHHGAEHLLALAPAEHPVGLDALEHAAQQLRDEHTLILLGGAGGLGDVRGLAGPVHRALLRQETRVGDCRVHQPITSISAWSAPAALIACRMEMMSRGPTPSAFNPSTRCCSDTPSCITAMRLPRLSSTWMLVRGTTWVVPVLEKGVGWLTWGVSVTLMVRLPWAIATVEMRTSAPITITPLFSSMITLAGWSGSTLTCSMSVRSDITPPG